MSEKVSPVRLSQAAELLASGVKQAEVADRTGISNSYLSELINHNKNFQDSVRLKLGGTKKLTEEIDNRLDLLEARTWKAIDQNFQFFNKPELLLKLAGQLNSAKRRSEGEAKTGGDTNITVVNLELPAFMVHQMKEIPAVKNTNNQVVEIDGRVMVTANSGNLIDEATRHIHKETVEAPQIEMAVSVEDISDEQWEQINL